MNEPIRAVLGFKPDRLFKRVDVNMLMKSLGATSVRVDKQGDRVTIDFVMDPDQFDQLTQQDTLMRIMVLLLAVNDGTFRITKVGAKEKREDSATLAGESDAFVTVEPPAEGKRSFKLPFNDPRRRD